MKKYYFNIFEKEYKLKIIEYHMVKIDKKKCIGCGNCSAVCPEIFEIDKKDNKARVKSEKKLPCIKEAIRNCPVGAISE